MAAVTDFYERVRDEVPGCPQHLIQRYVIEGLIEFCRDTQYFTKTSEHTVASTDPDTLTNNEVQLSVDITGMRPVSLKSLYLNGNLYDSFYLDLSQDITDIETLFNPYHSKYYRFPGADTIAIFPVKEGDFQSGDSLDAVLQIVYEFTEEVSSVDDSFFRDARKAVESYAAAEIAAKPRQEWTSPDIAMKNHKRYIWAVNDFKIDDRLKKHGGSMKVKMRPFV